MSFWPACARKLRIKDLNDRLTAANEKLQELVDIDDLTGLYNMRSIYHKIDTEISRAKRFNRCVGVIMLDMDNFKSVNDTHDHLFGSFVLGEVGKIIRENIRTVDFAARYGGDEFLITLSETTPEGAVRFSNRLREAVQYHLFTNKISAMHLTVSAGVSICAPEMIGMEARSLVRCADQALYDAKRFGKNCVKNYDMAAFGLKKSS